MTTSTSTSTSTSTKKTASTRKKTATATAAAVATPRTCPRCGAGTVADDYSPCTVCRATPSGFMRVAWVAPRTGM